MKKIFTLFCAACAVSFGAQAADPLMVMLDWDNDDNRDIPVYQAGQTLTIESYVDGGEAPYTYRWRKSAPRPHFLLWLLCLRHIVCL